MAATEPTEAELKVGDEVALWQRKTLVVRQGVLKSWDDVAKQFVVRYDNGATATASREWLVERMAEARNPPIVAEEAVEAKRAAAFARLQGRHEQRKAEAAARREADQAHVDPTESAAAFWAELTPLLDSTGALIAKSVATHTVKLKRTAARKEISDIAGARRGDVLRNLRPSGGWWVVVGDRAGNRGRQAGRCHFAPCQS
jgi:hypothetical protein